VWAGVTTIYTGQTQRPYTAQALDPLTGNETASDRINGGFGIVLSGGAGLLARGTQVAGQVASKGDEIATAVGTIARRGDDAVGVVDDVAGSAGSSSAGVASGAFANIGELAAEHQATLKAVWRGEQPLTALPESVRQLLAGLYYRVASENPAGFAQAAFNEARAKFLLGQGPNPGPSVNEFAKLMNIPVFKR